MERCELIIYGQFIYVDRSDFEFVSKLGMSIINRDGLKHLIINTQPFHKQYLHRVLLGITDSNVIIDHKDRNGLNNCRDNLRITTKAGNSLNMKVNKNKKSGFPKGVYKERDGFKAQIKYNHLNRYLGHFSTIEAAENRYKQELKLYWKRCEEGSIIK